MFNNEKHPISASTNPIQELRSTLERTERNPASSRPRPFGPKAQKGTYPERKNSAKKTTALNARIIIGFWVSVCVLRMPSQ